MSEVSEIQVGTGIVYKGDMANPSGRGAVVQVVAGKSSAQMFNMDFGAGKLVPIDTSKSYSVILEDGRVIKGIYSSEIGGEFGNKRFMLSDAVYSPEQIAEAKKIGKKYESGRFDARTDYAYNDPTAFATVFGEVTYVFFSNDQGYSI